MGDLLHRRENEGGQAFPAGLTQDPQATATERSLPDDGVVAGGADRIQIVVEGELMAELLHANPTEFQTVVSLSHEHG
jgi:hypothetical protein